MGKENQGVSDGAAMAKPCGQGGISIPVHGGVRASASSRRVLLVRPCLDRFPGPVTLTQPRRRRPRPGLGEFLRIPLPEQRCARGRG